MTLFDFEEGQGNLAHDSSVNQNTATLINEPAWSSRQTEGAIEFDGSDDLLLVDEPTGLTLSGDVSLMAWTYLDVFDPTAYYTIVATGVGGSHGYALNVRRGVFNFVNIGNEDIPSTITPIVGEWHHFATTFTASTLDVHFFVDGVLVDTQTAAMDLTQPQAGDDLIVGAWISGSNSYWDGRLDQVRLYSRALSEQEVAQIVDFETR
ncbi:LamG domain-containing protein [Myxococcota bacterium]